MVGITAAQRYHVPVHMDVPEIDVIWTDNSDPHAHMGAHGVGEIGIKVSVRQLQTPCTTP
jgi:CO/xanthine dehydrogenase Mo-binding subunit